MEHQGKTATTHDFVSLREDSSSPDARFPRQGFILKTHDFLPRLESLQSGRGSGATRAGEATLAAIDLNVAVAATAPTAAKPGVLERKLPCSVGAHADGHPRDHAPVVVKPEWLTYSHRSPGTSCPETKADTEACGAVAMVTCGGNRNGSGGTSSYEPAGVRWMEAGVYPRDTVVDDTRGPRHHHLQLQQQQPWPSPSSLPAARGGGSSFPPSSTSSGKQPVLMDAVSRSSKGGFADDDDDEDEDFGKNGTSSHKGLTVRVDGGNGNNINTNGNTSDQKPSTPRSKHSATEQRRRSKINDRFQILRNLIPHSDQKRDKASFLLEVIEYIQLLQEKVQKYEASYPGWSHDNVKLMPWKGSQIPGESLVDPSYIVRNGPMTSGFIFPADGTIANAPTVVLNTQNVAESENVSCGGLPSNSVSMQIPMQYPPGDGGGLFQPQQRVNCDPENMAAQPQGQWLRSCNTDCSVSRDISSGQDDLVIDEGTVSLSSMYSEGLLNNLTHTLRCSGVDLSEASISVQISLGRQTISRPMSSAKDKDDPSPTNRVVGNSRVGSSGEESEQANKRRRSDAI